MNYHLKCITCKKEYTQSEVQYTCPSCGDRLGTLEVLYDYPAIKLQKSNFSKFSNIWQFEKLLPLQEKDYRTHLHVGGTPCYRFPNFGGIREVSVKYEGGNPTASFKDRATALAVAKALGAGFDRIFCASTGNAASSLAGVTASTPLKSYIFLPAKAPIAKISQLFVYGSVVIPIDGTYDEAFDISLEVGLKKGWYCRNSAVNPFLLEGKKTCALEIAVQTDWNPPDTLLVSAGDGTVVSSFYKGFYDLLMVGAIDRIPKIIGVQAKGSNAIKRTFEKGFPYQPEDMEAHTVADSISVGKPRDVIKACNYIQACKGDFIEVEDEEILNASLEMAKNMGIFGEPAGSASYAGFQKMIRENKIKESERVCLIVTGSGLKDIKSMEQFVRLKPVKPDLKSVLKYIEAY